jgi:hypothetical protein
MKLNTRFPFFLFLLPVFFFLHGFAENFVPGLFDVAGKLAIIYIGIAIAIAALAWLLLKDIRKAAFASFCLMAFNFFFGSVHDQLRHYFPNAFFIRYTFIVAGLLIATVLLFIWLKRTKRTLGRTSQFLNLLLLVLIVIDCITLFSRLAEKRENDVANLSSQYVGCDTCSKPDIYLIIADEYAGKKELRELFAYDNSAFENELRRRGFYVSDSSTSNYNATVYSMASMMSMDYIKNLDAQTVNHRDMQVCRQFIDHNNFIRFIKKQGYTVFNHSYFEVDNKKKAVFNPFYPSSESLFIYQTFTHRLQKDIGFHWLSEKDIEKVVKHHLYNNKTIEQLARETALKKDITPKFVYTHLAMPHHPYYFDRNGNEYPYKQLTDSFTMNKKAYIEYLEYANTKLLQLIDHIKSSSAKDPVIILVSDHGFRQLPADVPGYYWFINFQAVHVPASDYSKFYPGMSNVNLLRAFLNTQFNQRLPMLKDSTSFLKEHHNDF